jgi:double-strand break repair protein AddB
MFENDQPAPRLFAQDLGTDFPDAVVRGIRQRMANKPPEETAKVTLIVNTARMRRRVQKLFSKSGAGFLPRILLLTDIESLLPGPPPPPARPALVRQLQLAELLTPIIKDRPEFAPKSSVFSLANSLSTLMDEMQGEGSDIAAIENLDVSDESSHWAFAKNLISVAYNYVSELESGQDPEARQRAIVFMLDAYWAEHPPEHPVLLAGSTGSRGTTFHLMETIAKLPNGAVLLPGFDRHMPDSVWSDMTDALRYEDHPQFRFARIMQSLGLRRSQVDHWADEVSPSHARNKVISLALRPAPVTDAWLREGPDLPNLPEALQDVTLLEAPNQRSEALAISMRMRMAAEDGQSVALISPDRMLGRQVAASLDRWGILPDDSGGTPLHLSAPGRFLRHTAQLFLRPLDAESLLILLKHPLTQSGDVFPDHGLYTQRLELALRKTRGPSPDKESLRSVVQSLAVGRPDEDQMLAWCEWLVTCFCNHLDTGTYGLSFWLAKHLALSEVIAAGAPDTDSELWDKAAGQQAKRAWAEMEDCAHHSGDMSAADYLQFFTSVLTQHEVRDRDAPHPGVMIWGTLEARVQGADLVILGGLNDGVWPEAFAADPWLNRRMRHKAGLLLPDRKTGLSAHDFQQAIAAPEVWVTRSVRSDDAETVASRWVNRLTNMIDGLPDRDGPKALKDMKQRGQDWLRRVAALEAFVPVSPEKRAAPLPPVSARPRDLSVTEVRTLIRDPYAIYARHCLGLRPLDPLVQEPDAPVRGIVIHEIMEAFVNSVVANRSNLTKQNLMEITDATLDAEVPWAAARLMWRARIARIADWVVDTEKRRLDRASPAALERTAQAKLPLPAVGGSIRARADRIDVTETGEAVLYDYKSGSPPTRKQQKAFDRQLLIEAAMVEAGAFHDLGPRKVADAVYIGLGSKPVEQAAPLDDEPPSETIKRLEQLIADYLEPDQHFLSRRMLMTDRESGVYDHLARHGEWDDADDPAPEDLS